ncbi:two pore calcium channel protein 1 [Pistacia vera]|uniref:two pore calcium channel protein 1 n=1 Tax=Pistacia vera TaxID=55513 RepID=UPI001263816B|nr:two pore calcium channel protein 1 [Pistacia vera]
MDKALLISGESSNTNNIRPPSSYTRRSQAITRGSRYQKAAALVDLAADGDGLPEEILDQSESSFETSAKFYFMFIKFEFIWSLNYFALIVLNFLEKPLWCSKSSLTYSCTDRDYYYLGQLPYLSGTESLIYEGITLIVLVIHTFFPISFEGSQVYWKNPFTRLKVMCLLILVADLLVYVLYLSPVAFDSLPLRIAPYIRVAFFTLNIRELRDSIFVLAGMLGMYLNVLALGLLFLLIASWVAYVMFEDTQQGKTVFTSYGTTLYKMLILFTTSNNPDVWIPAYKDNPQMKVTNLILAVVYDSFKGQLAKQVSDMDRMRKSILGKAFNLIDKDNVGSLDKEQCIQLFQELNKYRTLPKISREEFELIFYELDDTHDFKINLDEFYDLCNAIALRFLKEDAPSCFERFPLVYRSPFSEKLKAFVRSPKFGYIITFILVVNLAAVIVETMLDIENSSGQKVWQEVEFVFGWIYVLEMALKVYSFGFENYWRDGQNRFDFLITWIIVIGETITFVSPNSLTFLSNGEWIRYLLLARMLRLIRILMHVQRYRAFLATFLTLIPSLMPYLGIIFCVLCIYCSLGVQIFGGIVNVGNTKVEETDLADDDYLLFNFNDYPNGMVTLFNLLVMNNWQDWMQSYKELTGTSWTLVYFISFYLINVVLLLNLIVAFILEAFFAELECEEDDKDGRSKERRRYVVGAKTRSQRVDRLLHHMLSAELNDSGDT